MFETNASGLTIYDLRFTSPFAFQNLSPMRKSQIVNRKLFHGIDQRRKSLDADFEAVAGFNRPDAAGRAGQDHVAGQQGHVRRDKADEMVAVEDELAGVRVLPQLTVLEKLDGQIVRIDFRFDVRSQRRERVE